MKELHIMILLGAGPIMWMLGGFKWKWIRRFLWPATVAVVLLVAHTPTNRVLLVTASMVVVNIFPYGDKTPWFVRWIVFSLYAIPACFIGVKSLFFSVPTCEIVLSGLMYISKKFNWASWKVWEASAGLLQAISVVFATMSGG